MNDSCHPRLVRRFRRPATRSQVRRCIDQFHGLYQAEAILDRLNDPFLNETLCSVEEQI